MKTQSFSLLWLVAVCAVWTVLCEPEFNGGVIADGNSGEELNQNGPQETAEPSEHGDVNAELSSLVEASVAEKNSNGAQTGQIASEDEIETERRFSRVSRDCEDLRRRGYKSNGVYTIRPDRQGRAFKVYCDMTTDGGGWTVFQRRKDGSQNFYLPWNNYVNGFGNIGGEFFLGLIKIHRLTQKNDSELRVELEQWSGSKSYAKYSSFAVGNSASKYPLTVSGYSGNAGDSMSYHNGMKFSTYDQDNDVWNGNCAQTYKGAWWHNQCHFSNLNGAYLGTPSNGGTITTFADGVIWYHLKNSYYYSVKGDVMMVRRK
ncbi:hypothetical protein EMCRGX_G003531 [Ephydatia muelleri]